METRGVLGPGGNHALHFTTGEMVEWIAQPWPRIEGGRDYLGLTLCFAI